MGLERGCLEQCVGRGLHGWRVSASALVPWGCCDGVPQPGQLLPRECIISQFLRLDGKGTGRADVSGVLFALRYW